MPQRPDAFFWLTLEAVPGLGRDGVRRLLDAFPGVESICQASAAQLAPLVGDPLARGIAAGVDAALLQPGLDWLAAPENHLITWGDPAYPAQLRDLPDAPAWLYVKGDPDWLARPMLAIVGSRNATPQGLRDARAFAASLSQAGLTIVSGLALGIDAAAHEGGLAGLASSVAVVGTGLDRVYPARNRELAHRLAAGGAIVSEFPIGTAPKRGHFPRRNRLISGLSLGVLVVEAALQSGSLITARLAGEQGRDVFAIPGSIHSSLSKGCHRLIKQGAKLVESANDILEELGRELPPSAPATAAPEGADDLLETLSGGPLAPDQLAGRLGLTVETLSVRLLAAEMNGQVARMPGGLYQRLY
ncbi:MAG: DNA-protecting protein DprA [Hydrogenophilales bacterium CG_4_9_14_3_um_filter_63_34]|nr:MAG: DNA-protecting protein DprA [Hydrogenophilales bacterium CG_4_10_14_3_um_filter_63_21]PJB07518.1 MAG: DNA-protecting protein DprA [Hydrogenophilales bacterium CG_4_9_14_3_um_filter_63_34]